MSRKDLDGNNVGSVQARPTHPFYLANFLIDEGVCLISGNLWLVTLYVVAFLFVYLPTIRREERHLTHVHGDAYTSYARAVPALLPYRLHVIFGPLRFSWANIKRKKEMSRVLRILAIPSYFIIVGAMFHEAPYVGAQRAVLLWTAMSFALLLNAGSILVRGHERARRWYVAETTTGRRSPDNDRSVDGQDDRGRASDAPAPPRRRSAQRESLATAILPEGVGP